MASTLDIKHEPPSLDRAFLRLTKQQSIALGVVLLGFLTLCAALGLTRPPHQDEGHFASAAADFARNRHLSMPMWTEWIPTLDRYMYVTMPLYFVGMGTWFQAFGDSWASIRFYSVAWGFVLVCAWFQIGRRLTNRAWTGIAVAAMIAFNYDIINMASARYDIMCAGLGACGLAAYLCLRERQFSASILVGLSCIAAACLTHPYGVIGGAGLLVFIVQLDFRRVRVQHLFLAAIPFIIGFGVWGLYISKNPQIFHDQMAENASDRLSGLRHPLNSLIAELHDRYLVAIGGWRSDLPITSKAKMLLLVAYIAGIGTLVMTPALRGIPAVRALLVYALTVFVLLWLFENYRWYIYALHALPVYAACVGVAVEYFLSNGRKMRTTAAVAASAYGLFAVATVAYRARINVQGTAYADAAAFLRQNVKSKDLVMAGGEFGVGLGYAAHVLDDPRLGQRNGRKPAFFVINREFEAQEKVAVANDALFGEYLQSMLSDYKVVFETERAGYFYRVYAPR